MSNKRTSLPLWKKYDIVNKVNRRNDAPVLMLAKKLEILRTSLITILKNKEKLIEDFEASCSSKMKRNSFCLHKTGCLVLIKVASSRHRICLHIKTFK